MNESGSATSPCGKRRIEWSPEPRYKLGYLLEVAQEDAARDGETIGHWFDDVAGWSIMDLDRPLDFDHLRQTFDFASGIDLGVDREGDTYVIDRRHRVVVFGYSLTHHKKPGYSRELIDTKLADPEVVGGSAAAVRAHLLQPPPMFASDGRQCIARRRDQPTAYHHLMPIVEAEKTWGNRVTRNFHRPDYHFTDLEVSFSDPLHVDRLCETFALGPDIGLDVCHAGGAMVSDSRNGVVLRGAAVMNWPKLPRPSGLRSALGSLLRRPARNEPPATTRPRITPTLGQPTTYAHLLPVLDALSKSARSGCYSVYRDPLTGWHSFEFREVVGFRGVLDAFELSEDIQIGIASGGRDYLVDSAQRVAIWNCAHSENAVDVVPFRSENDRRFSWLAVAGYLSRKESA